MRRLIAFITMAVSILLAILFNTQVILDNKVLSSEYGGGTEFVYRITEKYDTNGSSLENVDVKEELVERYKLTNSSNGDIEVVELHDNDNELYYEARVKVGANTTNEINAIDSILSRNGRLTFCTGDDVVCKTQNELLEKDSPAKLVYSGTTGYPALKVSSKSVWEELTNHAAELSDNDNIKDKIYLWENKFEDDSYEKAFDSDEPDKKMQKKIIATLTKDNYNEDIESIVLTSDRNGNAYNTTSSRAAVTAFNADDYNFEIEKVYQNKFDATLGSNALTLSLVGMLIVFLAAAILLSTIYGLPGFISFISIVATQSLLVTVFSFLGFAISPAAFIGMIIVLLLGVFISVNYFERIKDELKKGRHLDKSNKEGYHKSFLTTVDCSLVVFITSTLSFILANGMLQTLAAVVMIGSLFTFFVTNYLNKWMMYWFTTSEKYKTMTSIYGLRPKSLKLFVAENIYKTEEITQVSENTEKKEAKVTQVFNTNIKPKKNMIIGGSIAGGVALVAMIGMLSMGLTSNKIVNYDGNYVNSTYLTMRLEVNDTDPQDVQDYFLTKESFVAFLANTDNIRGEGEQNLLPSSYTNITFNVTEEEDELTSVTTNSIEVSFEVSPSDMSNEYVDQVKGLFASLGLSSEFTPVVNYGTATPILVNYELGNMYLVGSLALVWSLLYIFVRFGISTAVSHLFTQGTSLLFMFGLASLSRIPFNSFTGFAFLAVGLLTSFILIPIFNRNKEILKDRKLLKTGTKEDRMQSLAQSMNYYLPISVSFTVVSLISFVLFLSLGGSVIIPCSLLIVFALLVSLSLAIFVAPSVYYLIRCNLNFDKFNEKREQKKLNKKSKGSHKQKRLDKYEEEEKNQPHETIIIGINEFR